MSDNFSLYATTSSLHEGGGRSPVILIRPIVPLLLGVILLVNFGTTTNPQELLASNQERPTLAESLPLAPLFAPEVLRWRPSIIIWAEEWGLDPNLVATIMQIESCGDPAALSGSGAIGLFQVMPYHFEDGENAYQPETNAARGLSYLHLALDTYNGDYSLAFAAYNGGISGASKDPLLWSSEMIRYVYWGANIYRDASQGKSQSPYLVEWLNSGGATLCGQAREYLG